MITIFSGHSYRTTHVTGTITDAAIILSRTMFVGYYKETKKLFQLIPSILAYMAGGFGGYHAYQEYNRRAIGVNIVILILVSMYLAVWPRLLDYINPLPESAPPSRSTSRDNTPHLPGATTKGEDHFKY